jgi:hypothetical protein
MREATHRFLTQLIPKRDIFSRITSRKTPRPIDGPLLRKDRRSFCGTEMTLPLSILVQQCNTRVGSARAIAEGIT